MKLNSKIFVAGILATLTGVASANPVMDVYLGGTVGGGAATVFMDDDSKTQGAQSFGAIFGIDIPLLRVEAEIL